MADQRARRLVFAVGTGAINSSGRTALHHAIEWNASDQLVRELVFLWGIDVNARDAGGKTALHWAAFCDARPSLVDTLLACGARHTELDAPIVHPRTFGRSANLPLRWTALDWARVMNASSELRVRLKEAELTV